MTVKFARIPARAVGMKLTASEWAVLHAICLHGDKAGRAYPSMARIAVLCGRDRRVIPRSIKRLVNLGLLRREHVRRAGGWENTVYQILFDAPAGVSSPEMTSERVGVISGDDRDVISSDALTDHETDSLPERRVSKRELVGLGKEGSVLRPAGRPASGKPNGWAVP